MKYNKLRPTITASKICNVVKYESRTGNSLDGKLVCENPSEYEFRDG
jgi:hypothetical protein